MLSSKQAFLTLFALALSGHCPIGAQDKDDRPVPSPELAALQRQNAILEEKIKLVRQRQQLDRVGPGNPLARQSEIIGQRMKLMTKEQTLLALSDPQNFPKVSEGTLVVKDETTIESTRMAYTALSGIAANIAKELACRGKNVILYGSAHSDALLSLRTYNDQLDQLRGRLKLVLDLPAPTVPDQGAGGGGVFNVAALAEPVLQSVLDLISLFHTGATFPAGDVTADESGVVAVITNAAVAQGCNVYWPDQYVANPYNPSSQVMAGLQAMADLNDNGGDAAKSAGLQQKIRALDAAVKHSDDMIQSLSRKVEKEREKLSDAVKRVESLKTHIDWVSEHIKDEKDASFQARLNQSFVNGWQEMEAAVKKQHANSLPQTLEDQNRVNEMAKRVEAMKVQNDWLSKYVKDEKDLALQDKLKRTLASNWIELDAALKNEQALVASTPKAIEPDLKEQRQWEKYATDLKELITTTSAASEAYTTFRGALLDGSSGTSPMARMLRAESLRNLTFDEKFQERAGSSIVQLKLQKLAGTTHSKLRSDSKEGFSGGVVLSFVQYEPNGKLKNSGVHTAYSGFQNQP